MAGAFVIGKLIFVSIIGLTTALICRQTCEQEAFDSEDFWTSEQMHNVIPMKWGEPQKTSGTVVQTSSGGFSDLIENQPPAKQGTLVFGGKTPELKPIQKLSGKCNILFSGLNDAEKKQVVDIHNKLRSKVANGNQANQPPAGNMKELHWDDEMAHFAQILSDGCVYKHDKQSTKKYGALGQNVAWGGSTIAEKSPNFKGMIEYWYGEVALFKGHKVQPFTPAEEYGHYTQVVWGNTEAIGCGFTAYRDATGSFGKLLVCNYGSSGNVIRGSMYKIGKPCSACKSSCSKSNPGLCITG